MREIASAVRMDTWYLNMKKLLTIRVPHLLNIDQQRDRVSCFMEGLQPFQWNFTQSFSSLRYHDWKLDSLRHAPVTKKQPKHWAGRR